MTITELYNRLNDGRFENTFKAVSVPRFSGVYIGVSSSGQPCLFVEPKGEKFRGPSMKTSRVTLGIGRNYTISLSGSSPRIETLDSLICDSDEEVDKRTFISLIEGLLNDPAEGDIKRANLTAFFLSVSRLFSIPPAKDLGAEQQGLWGELFFMSRIKGFRFWFPFWHSEPTRKFDFSAPNLRLEVKTAEGNERIHQFSHRQVYPYGGEEIGLASILLRKEDTGLSLRKLIDSARDAISEEGQVIKLAKAERVSGMENSDEQGPSFDETEAERSLALFWAQDAPHFNMAEPEGVSQTHYRIDLSTAPAIPKEDLIEWLSKWA